jgi:hypothetical protein
MFKTKVTLVESLTGDPYYSVSYYVTLGNDGYWTTAKVFSFRYNEGGVWDQETNLRQAMELASRLEKTAERTEVTIYETPTPTDGNKAEK